jgi:hypothetical protein
VHKAASHAVIHQAIVGLFLPSGLWRLLNPSIDLSGTAHLVPWYLALLSPSHDKGQRAEHRALTFAPLRAASSKSPASAACLLMNTALCLVGEVDTGKHLVMGKARAIVVITFFD